MNKPILSFLFFLFCLSGFSQKVYFIYIQTENEQPFYVTLDKSLHSSSAGGYVILPKLRDTTYSFAIGFPRNKWPEQKFSVTVDKKDHGYLLKDFGNKGWGLFDLQTLAVQMSSTASVKGSSGGINKDVSFFADVLAKAADDPSLKETLSVASIENGKKTDLIVQEDKKKEEPVIEKKTAIVTPPVEKKEQPVLIAKSDDQLVIKKEEPAKEKEVVIISAPVVKKEEPVAAAKTDDQPAIKKEEAISPVTKNYKPSVIIKRSESSTTEGFGLVFLDRQEGGAIDTIRLLIPNPKPIVAAVKDNPKVQDKRFLDILEDTPKQDKEVGGGGKSLPIADAETTRIKTSDCSRVAEESDFFTLRKLMASAEGDDNMISEAKNYFRTKCFLTIQIKNLGSLFLNDAGRYKFFNAARDYVSDKSNFVSLQTELKDDYYITRFNDMVRN